MSKYYWLLIAALTGASCGLGANIKDVETSPGARLMYVFTGFCVSIFVTLGVAKYWNITDPEIFGLIGFVLALLWQRFYLKAVATIAEFRVPFIGGKNNNG